jgi:hypothetical protein
MNPLNLCWIIPLAYLSGLFTIALCVAARAGLHGDLVLKLQKDVGDLAVRYAQLLLDNARMIGALRLWEKVESEMKDNHPCPDLALRADYRKRAVVATREVLEKVERENRKS